VTEKIDSIDQQQALIPQKNKQPTARNHAEWLNMRAAKKGAASRAQDDWPTLV
jgi:hypothetical protein